MWKSKTQKKYDSIFKGCENKQTITLQSNEFIVIRLDGKNFRRFLKVMDKPFDSIMYKTMHSTMQAIYNNIPGAIMGYTFSDEINIIIGKCKNGSIWEEGRLEKIVSLSASMATRYFNKFYIDNVERAILSKGKSERQKKTNYYTVDFDSRAFKLDKGKVIEYLRYRQVFAYYYCMTRVGLQKYSGKEIGQLHPEQIRIKLMKDGVDIESIDRVYRYGCVYYTINGKVILNENIGDFEDKTLLLDRILNS